MNGWNERKYTEWCHSGPNLQNFILDGAGFKPSVLCLYHGVHIPSRKLEITIYETLFREKIVAYRLNGSRKGQWRRQKVKSGSEWNGKMKGQRQTLVISFYVLQPCLFDSLPMSASLPLWRSPREKKSRFIFCAPYIYWNKVKFLVTRTWREDGSFPTCI